MTITSIAQCDFVCDTIAERDSVTQYGVDGWRCFVKDDGTTNGRSYVLMGGIWTSSQPVTAGGAHTHPESEVTNLQTDLSAKAGVSHSHVPADITGTAVITNDARLSDARNPTSHAHPISDVTNLQTTLNGKAAAPVGVLDDLQISILQSDGTLNAASGVQTWAGTNGGAQDVFTVEANTTYSVSGKLIVNTGATTHTTALAWALSGATVTFFEYLAMLWSAALNTIATVQSTTHISGVASKVLNATSTAVYTIIEFEGIIVIINAGTITPQINFSANPTGTNLMKRGSWISFSKLGSNTFVKSGGWA